jgi:hypothetical protein
MGPPLREPKSFFIRHPTLKSRATFFRPCGTCGVLRLGTHGLRRGLHSFAAPRLGSDRTSGDRVVLAAFSYGSGQNPCVPVSNPCLALLPSAPLYG